MDEKRFTFIQDTLVKADVFDNNEFVCCTLSVWVEQLVDLLNELHEKNKRLEQRSKIRKDDYLETLNDLRRAYENNKKALNNIERLDKENEILKEQVNEMIDIFNDSGLDYHISDELEEILND